jgi:pilus assembly protein CpaC
MEIEGNNFQRCARCLSRYFALPTLLLALTLTSAAVVHAADDVSARKVIFVTLNAGESYVINNVSDGTTPAVHVLNNPNALIVSSDKPGEVVLVAAAAGQWAIDVTAADGQALRYKVSVNAIATPFTNPLAPGKNPPALGSPHFGSAADRTVTIADSSAVLPPATSPQPSSNGSSRTASATSPSFAAPAGASGSSPSAASSTKNASPGGATLAFANASLTTSPPLAAPSASSIGLPPTGVPSQPSAPPSTTLAQASSSPPPSLASSTAPIPAYAAPAASSPMLSVRQPEPGQIEQFRSNPPRVPSSPSVGGGRHYLPVDVIELSASSSRIIDFPKRLKRISIADSTIADVEVITPYQINLVGHKEGFTTLAIWDSTGRYEERQIRIDPYGKQQVMLNVIVAELDRSRLEQEGINWTLSMPNQGISLVGLPGQVATPYSPSVTLTPTTVLGAGTATQTTVSESATGTLPGAGSLIPLLLSSTINYGLAAGNSNFQTQFFFQALENHNFAKILAEPRLLANSGEKAEFLSGGEIPIVVAQALNTSIVFKKFGTSVIFIPTVIGSDDIQLEVRPEVSQPDYAHAVQLFGFSVPAFVTRTAQTSVRLRNDQTLIIAGLILHTKTSQLQKTPYLGDIPYVGALFRSTSYQDQENDLVMTVTPEIVAPIPVNGVAAYPTDRGPLSPAETATGPVYPQDVTRPRF